MKTKIKEKLENILKRGNYNYIDSNLTTENFPIPDKIQTENWKLIRMEKSFTSQEALDEIKKQGCRPANAYELVLWFENHKKELKDYEWCLALGQLWFDGGCRRVPCVYRLSDGDFVWDLGSFEGVWYGVDCLLCFCDQNSETLPLNSDLETLTLRISKLEETLSKIKKLL